MAKRFRDGDCVVVGGKIGTIVDCRRGGDCTVRYGTHSDRYVSRKSMRHCGSGGRRRKTQLGCGCGGR